MIQIDPSNYEAYEMIITSGQMSDRDAVAFLDVNPDFRAWYIARHDLSVRVFDSHVESHDDQATHKGEK